MGMKIKIRHVRDVPVVVVTGNVNSEDAIRLSHKLETFPAKKSISRVVVDLSGIGYIDSHWLGVFVYSWRLFNEHGKELIFLIPPGFILDLFKNSNLDRTFRIVGSLDTVFVPPPPGP